MDPHDLHPADDYSHRFFIWHEWIQAWGPLSAQNALDYFMTSMFYDKQSNNQVLRMQTMHTGQNMTPEQEAEELRGRFVGVEFALVHAEAPTFFIVHKRDRISPDESRPLAAYFIMNNRIYQSPDVYTVVSNRLLTALHSLQTSLDTLRKHRPAYTPRTGFIWPIVDKDGAEGEKTANEANGDEVTAESGLNPPDSQPEGSVKTKNAATGRKTQNNILLLHAMYTTANHANSSASLVEAGQQQDPPRSSVPASKAQTPMRSSMTPARGMTPAQPMPAAVAVKQEPVKGAPGQGKKKRKRTLPAGSTPALP